MTTITITHDNEMFAPDIVSDMDCPENFTTLEKHVAAMVVVADALAQMVRHTPFIAAPDKEADQ